MIFLGEFKGSFNSAPLGLTTLVVDLFPQLQVSMIKKSNQNFIDDIQEDYFQAIDIIPMNQITRSRLIKENYLSLVQLEKIESPLFYKICKLKPMIKQLFFLFLIPFSSVAQTADSTSLPSIYDFFIAEEISEITLEAEFDSILNSKKFNQYLDGELIFNNKDGVERRIPVRVKQRGKYRRRICNFPPLKLKFADEQLAAMGLQTNSEKLKIITHCLDDQYKSKENLLREYLVYKLFELHSEKCFRVHLVKVKYKTPHEKKIRFERYAIVLEDDKNMAKRVGGKIFDTINCPIKKMNPEDLKTNAVYQFMIGNSDWDPIKVRNIKLVQKDSLELFDVIPYDFDFSGLVNATYAIPNPNFKIKNIRDRVMQCKFESEEELQKIVNLFLNKKETVLDYCKNFKVLSKASRRDIKDYLNSFYTILEDEELRKNAFMIQEVTTEKN